MGVSSSGSDEFGEETQVRADLNAALGLAFTNEISDKIENEAEQKGVEPDQIGENLEIAVSIALDRVLESRQRDLTGLESEILAFLANQKLDLGLTYSWYINGPGTATGFLSEYNTGSENDNEAEIAADRASQLTLTEFSARSAGNDPPDEYIEFFTSGTLFGSYELEQIWYTDRFDFLEDFYEEFAPDEYRGLYLTSAKIRSSLYDLTGTLNDRGQNTTLGDFGGGASDTLLDPSTEREIRYLISDLHMELAATDGLEQTQPTVTDGTDLIERVLARLTQMESVSTKQRRLVNQLSDFFFYWVWKYPALAISVETATGPNALELKTRHLKEFKNFDQTVERRREQFAEACRDADLLPSVDNLQRSNIDDEDGIIFRDE